MTGKQPISLRVESELLEWFRRAQPRGYQTLMHSVLKRYMQEQSEAAARRAGRAQEFFHNYYAQCFWHYDPSLQITPQNIQLVIDGLRKYGGRDGLRLAEELCR